MNTRSKEVKTVIKYALLVVAGVLLFKWGQAIAFSYRGYRALGGETAFITLPLLWFVIEKMIRDTTHALRGGEERQDNK